MTQKSKFEENCRPEGIPEVDSVHAIQSNIPSKITAAMKLKGGSEINFQIDTGTPFQRKKNITFDKIAHRR